MARLCRCQVIVPTGSVSGIGLGSRWRRSGNHRTHATATTVPTIAKAAAAQYAPVGPTPSMRNPATAEPVAAPMS